MAAEVETALTVRRVPFEFPHDLDPVLIEDCPEESYVYVALSLVLPYAEPYAIRSMRAAKQHVRDPQLVADLDAFNAQEGQHYKQHIRFNEAMRRLRGCGKLVELEAELDADYRRYTESKSLRFNLAYIEGFEASTSALARFALETGLLNRFHAAAREIYGWHVAEELEHRKVAFDVYASVCGGYLYRLLVGFFAQWHLCRFVVRATIALLDADRDVLRERYGGGAAARARLRSFFGQLVRRWLPKVLATYLPWYTPHEIDMPEEAQALADHYAGLARAR